MRLLTHNTTIIAGALLTLGLGLGFTGAAKADQKGFCVTGRALSEQATIDCAERWVAADGTRFGARIDPRNTPKTAHPAWRDQRTTDYGHRQAASTVYTTHASRTPASVWTPPEPHYQSGAPVVLTRGNQVNAYDGNYEVYVPTHTFPAPRQPCNTVQGGHHGATVPLCGSNAPVAPLEGCFTVDANNNTHAVPCPASDSHVYTNTSHHSQAPVLAQASASATANVNISSTGFFNTLSGGVGGSAPMFFGGGGSTIITGGGGSVLSRSPLIRFRSRNRGGGGGHGGHGGGGCGCGGGGMMGGGGD